MSGCHQGSRLRGLRGRVSGRAARAGVDWGARHEGTSFAVGRSEGRAKGLARICLALWSGCVLVLALLYGGLVLADDGGGAGTGIVANVVESSTQYYQPSLAGIAQGPTKWAEYNAEEYYDGYLVYGTNKYACLLYALGLDPEDVDLVAWGKLGSESKGGAFYELAQKGYNTNCPAWLNVAVYEGWLWVCGVTPGTGSNPDYLWAFDIYHDEYVAAKRDAETIIGGGGGSGGGSGSGDSYGSVDGDYYVLEQVSDASPEIDIKLELTDAVSNWVSNNSVDNILIAARGRYNENSETWSIISSCLNIDDETTSIDVQENVITIRNESDSSISVKYIATNVSRATNASGVMSKSAQGAFSSGQRNISVNNSYNIYTTSETYDYLWIYYKGEYGGSGGGSDDPVPDPPDIDPPTPPKPKEPDPTPPDPPTPTPPDPPTPPTTPTDPYEPPISLPDPYLVEVPTQTDPTDYTPWLRAILQQLIYITEYFGDFAGRLAAQLMSHCLHIREHMTSVGVWLGTYINDGLVSVGGSINENVAAQAEYIVDSNYDLLEAHHEYLSDLAQWIVDNMNFNDGGSEFSDTNLLFWLKRIWARQGTGTVNSRPVDAATDYDGFSGWFGKLATSVGNDIADTNLTTISTSMARLRHTFPFSLPWDVQALIQAVEVDPVTPHVTIRIPATEWYEGYTYDIDMRWMDGAMMSVRTIELWAFVLYTLVHTRQLFEAMIGEE